MTPTVKQKYRPSVALILIAVNLTILALPLGSVLFFRIYEGRLVHETEAELISQAAVIAAAIAMISHRCSTANRLTPNTTQATR